MQEKNLTLRQYFEKTGIKMNFFAAKIGLGHSTLTRIASGQVPNLSVAKKIVDATNGMVSYESLLKSAVVKD